jgi:mannose-6-phosphate isomerase
MKLYPLQFQPIFKERIWGGTKLKTILNKSITSDITGESWEISSVDNDLSIVENGFLKGKTIVEVIDQFPQKLLGDKVYQQFGKKFPLLFKYLDAKEDLSIQVHPNDALALQRHNSFGKTEMWYVVQADKKAKLVVGFKNKSTKEEYLQRLTDNSLLEILDLKEVKKGDALLLNTGTVHAIGAGSLIAEIQQTSDITYRIYDFDRVDTNGNKRELHTEEALDAINFDLVDSQKDYTKAINTSNTMVDCEYFTTNYIPLQGNHSVHRDGASFVVYMCVEGEFSIQTEEGSYEYKLGATVLIPADLKEYTLKGNASLLEIYIS